MNPTSQGGDEQGAVPVIDSRSGFHAALRWGFDQSIAQGARSLWCVDRDFAAWPWDDTALLAQLAAWLRQPQRRLVLLAAHFDDMQRRFPRFTAWRRDWAHTIDCWVAPAEMAADLPSLLASDRAATVHLVDDVHWRGRASLDERRAHQWRGEIDVVLQRSERGFAVNTLGL